MFEWLKKTFFGTGDDKASEAKAGTKRDADLTAAQTAEPAAKKSKGNDGQSIFKSAEWDQHFNQLEQLIKKHGLRKVQKDKSMASSAMWLDDQMDRYKNYRSGSNGPKMTPGQAKRLEDAKLVTILPKPPRKSRKMSSYNDMIGPLRNFRIKYGHCNVPNTPQHAELFTWCRKLRARRRDREKQGAPVDFLTPAQLAELDSLNFIWRKGRGRPAVVK